MMVGENYKRNAEPPPRRYRRPANKVEAVAQIREIYRVNNWDEDEQATNHRMLGLEGKDLQAYSVEELRTIMADLEKSKMILYEN